MCDKEKETMNGEAKNLHDEMRSFIFDIRAKKLELIEMFDDVFEICKILVDMAKADPSSVKATMLAQILRMLSQSAGILKMAEALREEIDEAIERDTDDGMTPEERALLDEFKEMTSDMDLLDDSTGVRGSGVKGLDQKFNNSKF